MFQILDPLIKPHGDHAQDDNGGYHHVELEDLRAINNQISKPSSCGKKLADDNAHKGKADIDLHVAQNGRDGRRKHHLCKGGKTASSKGIDELQLFLGGGLEHGVQADYGSEQRNGNPGNDDGVDPGAKPYDKKRCESGLWKAV